MPNKSRPNVGNQVAQNSVAERRLRPVYDWLDCGNNKKALQEAQKVLKKQPDFPCCKALKSLALLRLGKEDEATPILDSILEAGTSDDGALQAMTICFRELQQPDKICTLYETAVQRDPGNEELLSQLFLSYVRVGAYKKQQIAAMALYKAKAKTPYYFWAVMSVVMQAKSCGDEKMAHNLILPLAERMIAKMDDEGKMEQEQETRLYLMVLEMQQKYGHALKVIDGPLGRKLEGSSAFLDFIPHTRLNYLKRLEAWDKVNVAAKYILVKSPDQWNVYLDYITSIFRLVDNTDDDKSKYEESVDSSVADAVNFITFQKENNPKCRGPYLAQIELQSRLLARRDKDTKMDELADLLINYYEAFGDKPCCISDLTLYLPNLEANEVDRYLGETWKMIQFEDATSEVPKTVKDINRQVCWFAMNRLAGRQHGISADEKRCLARRLLGLYEATKGLVADFNRSEDRPNSNYVTMACHILWELWFDTDDDANFWTAVTSLSAALVLSPASFNLRFLLIKFLNKVGGVGASNSTHIGLELKHVQTDTLGYVLCHHIQTCGHFITAIGLFTNTLKFFTSNYKDVINFVISAYRCGSFDKIVEFINLRQRLSASQHYSSLHVERTLLDLLVETSLHSQTVQMMSYHEIDPDKDDISWTDLTDNRDFKVMVTWDPVDRRVTDELICESFLQDQRFLRYRSLVLRSLAAAIYLSEDIYPARKACNGAEVDRTSAMASVLRRLVEKLSAHDADVKSTESNFKPPAGPVQGPDPSRISLYVEGRHAEFFVALLEAVLAVHEKKVVGVDLRRTVVDFYAGMAEAAKKCADGAMRNRDRFLETVFNVVESASFAAVLFGVCQRLISPLASANSSDSNPGSDSNAAGKRVKKKGNLVTVNAPNENTSAFNHAIDDFVDILGNLYAFIDTAEKDICAAVKADDLACDLDSNLKLDSIESGAKNRVANELEKSYRETFYQVKQVVKSKTGYFASLKL